MSDKLMTIIGDLRREIEQQQAEIEKLREALDLYANRANWWTTRGYDNRLVWWGQGNNGWEVAERVLREDK